jgi:putative hydrolase of the HAD superfamily
MAAIRAVAFAGDDLLWHQDHVHRLTHERFRALVTAHVPHADVDGRLHATESRNLALFGHGPKGFALSMIETAIELTEGAIPAEDIAEIVDWAKDMARRPVELVDGAEAALDALAGRVRLLLVAKGDLFDQESRLARSGLADRFDHVEIVSAKDDVTYRRLLQRQRLAPEAFLMCGPSMRADVMPVLRLGGRAVHIPYPVSWAHAEVEAADMPADAWRLANIAELPGLLETFDA